MSCYGFGLGLSGGGAGWGGRNFGIDGRGGEHELWGLCLLE